MTEPLITKKQKLRLKELFIKHGVNKNIDHLTKGQALKLINLHQKWHKLTDEEKNKELG
jgi:hypothetical protein